MSACSVTLYFHLGTLLPHRLLPRDPSHRRGAAGEGLSKERVPGSALLAMGAGEGQELLSCESPGQDMGHTGMHWITLGELREQQGQQLEITCVLRWCDQAVRCTWG